MKIYFFHFFPPLIFKNFKTQIGKIQGICRKNKNCSEISEVLSIICPHSRNFQNSWSKVIHSTAQCTPCYFIYFAPDLEWPMRTYQSRVSPSYFDSLPCPYRALRRVDQRVYPPMNIWIDSFSRGQLCHYAVVNYFLMYH